jgi:hypothetical protein
MTAARKLCTDEPASGCRSPKVRLATGRDDRVSRDVRPRPQAVPTVPAEGLCDTTFEPT